MNWLETIATAQRLVRRAALARRIAGRYRNAARDDAPVAVGLEREACRLEMQAERMLLELRPLGGWRACRRLLGLPVSAGTVCDVARERVFSSLGSYIEDAQPGERVTIVLD